MSDNNKMIGNKMLPFINQSISIAQKYPHTERARAKYANKENRLAACFTCEFDYVILVDRRRAVCVVLTPVCRLSC